MLSLEFPSFPVLNHSEDVMNRMLDFVSEKTDIKDVELLPFHRLGAGKYSGLGLEYPCSGLSNVDKEECRGYEEYGERLGLSIHTGAV